MTHFSEPSSALSVRCCGAGLGESDALRRGDGTGAAPAEAETAQAGILACIGANIRARRAVLDLTQRDLSRGAGVDRAFLNQVEHGQRNPTIVVLAKLAHALGTTASALTQGCELVAAGIDHRSPQANQ